MCHPWNIWEIQGCIWVYLGVSHSTRLRCFSVVWHDNLRSLTFLDKPLWRWKRLMFEVNCDIFRPLWWRGRNYSENQISGDFKGFSQIKGFNFVSDRKYSGNWNFLEKKWFIFLIWNELLYCFAESFLTDIWIFVQKSGLKDQKY